MIQKINVLLDGSIHQKQQFDFPEKCIYCYKHVGILPSTENNTYSGYSGFFNYTSQTFVINAICPACYRNYTLEYDENRIIIDFQTSPEVKVEFPENVSNISEKFIEIYKQSLMAEKYGLNQIAGVGYRKSIEFLIKDYAISKVETESEVESIKSMWLMPVINEHLKEYPKLKALATAGTWIGNDETHYVKTHENKDISDLKRFITAAATYISADIEANLALETIKK